VNVIPDARREEDWDSYDDEFEDTIPGRPRRQFLNKWSALLFALILGGVGFYVGIRVEKHQLAGSSTGSGFAGALASRFGGAGATGAAGATATTGGASTTATSGTAGAGTGAGASGFAGRFGGGAGGFAGALGGSGGTVGTVSSVDGNTLYIQETSGNTVKVVLSSATKVTKTESVSKSKVDPGDTVIAAGVTGKNGTVTATSLTDSGVRSTGSTSNSTGASGSGSGGVGSLF
jgi:hypothetical protein